MGFPQELLSSRAKVKPGLWSVIPAEGLVNNVIPCIKDCACHVLASPRIGCGFVEIVVEGDRGGKTVDKYAADAGVESFAYIVDGEAILSAGGVKEKHTAGGFIFSTPGEGLEFEITQDHTKVLLYKQRFVPYQDLFPHIVCENINEQPGHLYEDLPEVEMKDFFPADDLGFDMNFHTLSFEPGAGHVIAETHVQEHGAYVLSGQGMYLLDETWLGVQKNDFIWMGSFCIQAAYGVGRERFSYVYSRDCNRDPAV